jgi:hypothetical protein
MISGFAPGALLAQTYPLARGPRVRLRLPQVGDAPAIRSLLERQGLDPEELAVARLVRFDPRRRIVICAAALIDSRETILGVGEIGLGPEATVAPKQLYVDEQLTEGLDELLTQALVGRARASARTRAA